MLYPIPCILRYVKIGHFALSRGSILHGIGFCMRFMGLVLIRIFLAGHKLVRPLPPLHACDLAVPYCRTSRILSSNQRSLWRT